MYVPSTLTTSFMCHTFWDTDHIFGELDSWQVFDIHMIIVDDLCKLSSLHCLLKHPHPNLCVKLISLGQHIVSHNFGNCRTPATRFVGNIYQFSILDSLSLSLSLSLLSLSEQITHSSRKLFSKFLFALHINQNPWTQTFNVMVKFLDYGTKNLLLNLIF